ncbi:redoxin domain-containing protein [Thiolapillus sp.]|uniref:TlpA family protein disulfide reductase n=2 Tax=Thiolapillus sp. TaxID=2017437 RepID=UPI0025F63CB7|nr:redoxin domain-containing protein [Thiolapillus sp.]
MKKLLCFLLFLGLQTSLTQANAIKVKPFVVNSLSEIKKNYWGQPFVLMFWSKTCLYCMKELGLFGKLQKQFPNISVVTVSTDVYLDEKTINDILTGKDLVLKTAWVFATEYPEQLYAAVDKRWRGELPVTYFYDRQHQPIRHMGIVKEAALIAWMKQQTLTAMESEAKAVSPR